MWRITSNMWFYGKCLHLMVFPIRCWMLVIATLMVRGWWQGLRICVFIARCRPHYQIQESFDARLFTRCGASAPPPQNLMESTFSQPRDRSDGIRFPPLRSFEDNVHIIREWQHSMVPSVLRSTLQALLKYHSRGIKYVSCRELHKNSHCCKASLRSVDDNISLWVKCSPPDANYPVKNPSISVVKWRLGGSICNGTPTYVSPYSFVNNSTR